ncbi:MAG: hypothetical protein AAFQ51_03495 [Pseudomonadota bacterium]
MPERRRLTTLNKIYVYLECLLRGQGQNANCCDWIELEQTPDPDLLNAAAAHVARRHPALQAASRFEGWIDYSWTPNPDAYPEITFERCEGACPEHPDEALLQNIWGRPLDHKNGPPWRLHVTTFADKCVLQVVTSHIYTCGKSANLISAELLQAYAALYRGETPEDAVVDVADRNSNVLFTPGWSRFRRFRSWLATMRDLVLESVSRPVGLASNRAWAVSRGTTHVTFVEYEPELWQALRHFARSEEISRHPFYLAAWSEAVKGFNEAHGLRHPGPIKLMDNFSLRPFSDQSLDGFYDLCAPPYAMTVPYGRSTQQVRRQIHTQVERLKAGQILNEIARFNVYHWAILILGKSLGSRLVISTVAKSPFIVSNTGPVPPTILAPHPLNVLRYFSFPQLFQPGKIMLIVTSTPDRLRAVFLWDEDAIDAAAMCDDLVPRFRQALARSIDYTSSDVSVATAAE